MSTVLAKLEAVKVSQNGEKKSIYQLCEGDLIQVTLKKDGDKVGATLRGLFVRRTSSQFIGLQTALSYRPLPIEWIESITILYPFFSESEFPF